MKRTPAFQVNEWTKVHRPEVIRFAKVNQRQAGSPLHNHIHRGAVEIVFVLHGRFVTHISPETYNQTGGDILIVPPDVYHDSREENIERCLLYFCQITRPEKNRWFGFQPDSAAIIWKKLCKAHMFHSDNPEVYRNIFDKIYYYLHNPMIPLKEHRILDSFRELLFLLHDDMDNQETRHEENSPCVAAALDFIENGQWPQLPWDELCSRAGLSRSRLHARFKSEVGITIKDYFLTRKVRHAKERLAAESQTVTTIAMDLGFSSSQYFALVFKRYTGFTPGEYRRTCRSQDNRILNSKRTE